MIKVLAKLFIKDYKNIKDSKVRKAYGTLSCFVGIALNIFLFAGKYFAGMLSGSIAIMADAFNNLSDAGSSVITLLGFQIAAKKPSRDKPFGHGRVEYLTGLAVAVIIIFMGVELGRSSIDKIFNPEPVDKSMTALLILVVSVCVKLYMAFYNNLYGRKLNSTAMCATAVDSLSDSISTMVVFAATVIMIFTGVNIDGYCGSLVAVFIIAAGVRAMNETISPLLGSAPDPELVKQVESIVLSYEDIIGIHDMIIHDYGPGRQMISLHAEVPGNKDIFILHDTIDCAEAKIFDELGCEATIHMDPIDVNNKMVSYFKERIARELNKFDSSVTIHDFRIVPGETHNNLLFDVVVPHKYKLSDAEIKKVVDDIVSQFDGNCVAVIKVDKSYTG